MEDRIRYPFRNDHDITIALIEEFNSAVSSIERKIAEDHLTTLEVKKLIEQQYDTLSGRLEEVERRVAVIDPVEVAQLKQDVRETKQWQHDFNTTKHVAWIIASAGFVFIGYYLPTFVSLLKNIFFSGK
jgi:hypothetical protein